MTKLDEAYGQMAADEASELQFYRELADATLYLVLEREAEGEVIAPRVFDVAGGSVLLAFDSEDRLASLSDTPLAFVALPGRIIAQQMAGQGLSLGINLGTGAVCEMLMPPEALDWLVQMLGATPVSLEAQVAEFLPPTLVPEALIAALTRSAQAASGLAAVGLLAAVRYQDGRRGHMFSFVNAEVSAQAALARSVAEALAFSGIEAGELDVSFLVEADAGLARLLRVAKVFEVPEVVVEAIPDRPAPGMDPLAPPKLR